MKKVIFLFLNEMFIIRAGYRMRMPIAYIHLVHHHKIKEVIYAQVTLCPHISAPG